MVEIKILLKKSLWLIYISSILIIIASFIFDFPLLPRLDRDQPHQYLKIELKSSDGSKVSTQDISYWYDDIGKRNIYFKQDSDKCRNLIKNESDSIWKDIEHFAQSFSMAKKIKPIEIKAQCFSVSKIDKDCQTRHDQAQNHLLAITLVTDIENNKKRDISHDLLKKTSKCRNPIAVSDYKVIKLQ